MKASWVWLTLPHDAATLALIMLSAAFAMGCGSAGGADLFSPPGSGSLNLGGAAGASFGTGGYFSAEAGGSNGLGAGGAAFGSGGATFDDGGGAGGHGGAAGASGAPGGCSFDGSWGSYITVPVTWPATPLVLFAGSGSLQQWNLSEEHQTGTDITALTVLCGIFLPDLQSDFLGGYAKYGIRFPDALFDAGAPPKVTFVMKGKTTPTGLGFDTEPFAALLGLSLDNPTTAPWPAAGSIQLQDQDLDQNPGITVVPAAGAGYSLPPSDLGGGQAQLIYIAERTVSSFSGTVISCDEVHADVTIVNVDGKPGINSTVVGCHKVAGTECAAADASFIDANRPQYTASRAGTMVSVRLPSGSTCKDVRNRFPKQ